MLVPAATFTRRLGQVTGISVQALRVNGMPDADRFDKSGDRYLQRSELSADQWNEALRTALPVSNGYIDGCKHLVAGIAIPAILYRSGKQAGSVLKISANTAGGVVATISGGLSAGAELWHMAEKNDWSLSAWVNAAETTAFAAASGYVTTAVGTWAASAASTWVISAAILATAPATLVTALSIGAAVGAGGAVGWALSHVFDAVGDAMLH